MFIDNDKERLADEIFDAYFGGNEVVAYEIETKIMESEAFFKDLRDNFPSGGMALYDAYRKRIGQACEEIAGQYCVSQVKIDEAYRVFRL